MIYLDHAAATPLLPAVRVAMEPYLTDQFFNPSAPYLPAVRVREAYEAARHQLAQAIGAKSGEITLTAGATESVNLAFRSFQRIQIGTMEHPAVREAAGTALAVALGAPALPVILPDTELISIALADSTFGFIAPLSDIVETVRRERARRLQAGDPTPLYLHTDASQAANLLSLNVARLGVDLMTVSAAKIGGPKQIGLLYARTGVPLRPIVLGGGQENGLRSGTENVAGVIGFATALAHAQAKVASHQKHYQKLAQALKNDLQKDPSIEIVTAKRQLASFIPVFLPGLDAERLIYLLEDRGILVSTGAACSVNRYAENPVLQALGYSPEYIQGSLRLTLGSTNTPEQMPLAGAAIRAVVQAERERLQHG